MLREVYLFLSSFFDEIFKYDNLLETAMKEELRKYGLSEKEIDIYLSSLKAGEATANRLSELSGIRRSTVYEVIESLKKKGLIKSFSKEKKFYFIAAKPNTFIDILQEKERIIQNILPQLQEIEESVAEKPKTEVFEGITGVKNAANDMLNYPEILVYGASNIGDQVLGSYTANFAKKRVEKKIMMRAIIEKKLPKHMMEKDVARYTKIKTQSFLKNHNSVYFIYGSKVLIITLGEELMAVLVTSPSLVESQKKIFEFLWSTAKN